MNTLDNESVNAIRFLSIDAIQKANSGHPGLPLDAAPMMYILWTRHLKQNPKDSHWFNRDRFILSAGHGSAMLYSLLHLTGYNVSLNDLQSFRQYKSKTPGHPEYRVVDGVDCTTGPLGQGFGMAVGMAIAEKHLAALYNEPNYPIIDHYTFVLASDGDLMEGISHEAASLAGHQQLGKLIVLYDSNNISLDGTTKNTFTENEKQRFEAYGWQYLLVNDGNDLDSLDKAIMQAKSNSTQPTIIEVKTVIGYGSPKANTNAVHGSPIGQADMLETRKFYNWAYEPFVIPNEIYENYKNKIAGPGLKAEKHWLELLKQYSQQFPQKYKNLQKGMHNVLNNTWQKDFPASQIGENESGRATSQRVINAIAADNINFWGGSADLFTSNKTNIKADTAFEPQAPQGRNLWFGVREFAEAAAVNGIALHGGSRVFASTFFVFSDYMRAAIRLAAIQKLPVIFIFTHDSVAVGEDGLTHQPIEQLMSFRAMPNVNVFRPADANETVAAWQLALQSQSTPSLLVLTRQNLPTLDTANNPNIFKGGYIIAHEKGTNPDGILLATGSEVHLAISAQKKLADADIDVRVVSLPCWELFEQQSSSYQQSVLPDNIIKRLSIEMGSTQGWEHYVGSQGAMLGINRYGASGPGEQLIDAFGFNVANIVEKYNSL